MRKSIFLISFVLLSLVSISQAQNKLLERAEKAYAEEAYIEAIPLFEKFLKKHNQKEALVHLADSYRRIQKYEEAYSWYEAMQNYPNVKPVHFYRYAQVAMVLQKYKRAKKLFSDYSYKLPDDPRPGLFMSMIDSIEVLKGRTNYHNISNVSFNSQESDFAPMYFGSGEKIVFSSSRAKLAASKASFDFDGRPFLDLFTTIQSDSGRQYSRPKPLKGSLKTRFHEGTSAYDPFRNIFYFTRNSYDKRKLGKSQEDVVNLKIYFGNLENLGWKNLKGLPFNSNDYSVGHPALSPDGNRLVFVSDMPGGYGGTDLWISYRTDSSWSDPVNMGSYLNTPGNEMFPYLHRNGTLYFSSDGHPGFGGLDVFSARKRGLWSGVRNLGVPVNSSYDDFGYIRSLDRKTGYFASSRPGGNGGDDIYYYYINPPPPDCPLQQSKNYCLTLFERNTDPDLFADSSFVYEWVLGDGSKKRGLTVDHCYPGPGEYLVQLNVVDVASGDLFLNVAEYLIDLSDPTQVYIESPDTVYANTEVIFDGSESQLEVCEIESYEWDFGRGFVFRSQRTPFIFNEPGEYKIRLRINGGDPVGDKCAVCASKIIVVIPEPESQFGQRALTAVMMIGNFRIKPQRKGRGECLEQASQFCYRFYEAGNRNMGRKPYRYEWDMGDGNKITGLEVEHCFTEPDTYNIQLNVIDTLTGQIVENIKGYSFIISDLPTIYISGPDTIMSHSTTTYYGVVQEKGCRFSNFEWTTSDGQLIQGNPLEISFLEPGVHTLKITGQGLTRRADRQCQFCIERNIVVLDSLIIPEIIQEIDTPLETEVPETTQDTAQTEVVTEVPESDPPVNTPVDLFANINQNLINAGQNPVGNHFEEHSKDFLFRGILHDAKGKPISAGGTTVRLLGPEMEERYKIWGSGPDFYLALERDNIYTIIVERPGYLTRRETISTVEMANTELMEAIFVLLKAEIDQVIVLHNLYYDFDKWYIRADAARELMKWSYFLNDNPGISIELSSHTDVRGKDDYNLFLSQKRAESAVQFLEDFGVAKGRMIAVGYGEQKLMNNCENGVPCSEPAHQLNRRTEFRIIGLSAEMSAKVKYDPRDISNLGALYAGLEVDGISENSTEAVTEGEAWGKPEEKESMVSTESMVSQSEFDDSKVMYRVQIGLFRGEGGKLYFYNLREYYRDLTVDRDGDLKRYTIGKYDSYEAAAKVRDVLQIRGYKDAFVVSYFQGELVK